MRKQMRISDRALAVRFRSLVLVGVVGASPALAPAYTGSFTNNDFSVATGDWGVATNWSAKDAGVNYVPGASANYYNDARINGGRSVTVSTNVLPNSSQTRSVLVNDGQLHVGTSGILGAGSVGISAPSTLDLDGRIDTSSLSVSGAMTIDSGAALNLNSQWQFSVGGTGVVTFNGGTITDTGTIGGWKVGGTVNHSGGSSSMARALEIVGHYNLSGSGSVHAVSGINVGKLTSPNTYGDGDLNMTGGTLTAGVLNVLVYDSGAVGTSSATFSGGNATFNAGSRVGNPGNTGTGILTVIGHQADIAISKGLSNGVSGLVANNQNAPLILWGNGTLHFVVGSDGISPVKLTSTSPGDSRSISFLAGTLDMGLAQGFTPAFNTTYDLVTTNSTATLNGFRGLDPTGLALAAGDDANWSFAVVNNNGVSTLQATYVPEPGSVMSVLGLGGLSLLRRRRGRS